MIQNFGLKQVKSITLEFHANIGFIGYKWLKVKFPLEFKAMGCNTLSVYIMWNFHEKERGQFDFYTENKNLRAFLQIAAEQ